MNGILALASFTLFAAMMLWQKASVIITNAVSDSAKLRPTVDRCADSADSNEPHFTGCSSIL